MAINVGSAVAYLELDTSKFSKGFKSAYNDLKVFSDKSATAGNKLRGLSSTFDSVGKSLTKTVTVPLVGIGTAAVKTAAQFDSHMSEVKAISGATGEQFTQLRNKAIEMGAKTKYSASESAQAFKYMAMAGWDTKDMLNSISGVMNLAAASGEDLASVSDIVTDAMTAFGLSADGTTKVIKNGLTVEVSNATHFADVLAQASRKSNTNVAMMGETFKYVAPVAGALGYSVEDTAVAIGLMANSGIKATQAGTTLRTLLTNMAKPTDTMQSAMDYLGVSLETTDGKMKSFSEVMQDLRKSFGQCKMPMDTFKKKLAEIEAQHESGEITEKKYNAAIEDLTKKAYGAEGALKANLAASLAGTQGMSGLLAIVNATDEDFQNLTDSINNCDGVSQDMADTMNDNLNGSITLLKSAIESALISIGDRFTPVIRKLAENITGLVEKFNGLSDEQKDQIIKWGLIVAAIGPSLIVFSRITKLLASVADGFKLAKDAIFGFEKVLRRGTFELGKVTTYTKQIPGLLDNMMLAVNTNVEGYGLLGGSLRSVGQAFSFLISKINPVVVVITLLVASFATLWKTNEEFRNKVIGIWEQVKGKFQEFSDAITEKINALGFNFKDITDVIKGAWEGFTNVIASPIITNALQMIADTFGNVLDFVLGVVDTLLGLFTGNHEQFVNGIKEMLSAISNAVLDGIKNIGSLVGELLANVLELFGFDKAADAVRTFFTETFPKAIEGAKDKIKNAISNAIDAIMSFSDGVTKNFHKAIEGIKEFASNVKEFWTEKVPEVFKSGKDKVVEVVTGIKDKIKEGFTGALDAIKQFGENVKTFFTQTIPEAFVSFVTETVPNFVQSVITFFETLPEKVGFAIGQFLGKLYVFGSDMISWAAEAIPNLIDSIVTFFAELPGKVWTWLQNTIDKIKMWGTVMYSAAVMLVSNTVNAVVQWFSELPGKIWTWLQNVITKIKTWGSNMLSSAKTSTQNMVNTAVTIISQLPGKFWTWLQNTISKIASWGGNMVSSGKTATTNFISSVIDTLTSLPGKVWNILQQIPDKVYNLGSILYDAGRSAFTRLWDGIKSIGNGVLGWVQDFANKIGSFVSSIVSGFQSIVGQSNEAKSAAASVNGHHANGLDYVPFNGYRAYLHKGERVLTKQENEAYTRGRTAQGDTFNFYNVKPNAYEYARQMKKAKKELLEGF
jgi:TP901 family phage tail tape measure protein